MEQITLSLQILEELELNTSDMAPPTLSRFLPFLLHHVPLASMVVPFLTNFSSLRDHKVSTPRCQSPFCITSCNPIQICPSSRHKCPCICPSMLPSGNIYPFLLTGQWTENVALGAGSSGPAATRTQISSSVLE